MNKKYTCSISKENWYECECFNTKKEAIDYGMFLAKSDKVDCFYVGIMKRYEPELNAEGILETISNNAYDDYSDYEEYLCDVPSSEIEILQDRLQSVLDMWLKEFNHEPNFYNIENIEEIEVEKQDE